MGRRKKRQKFTLLIAFILLLALCFPTPAFALTTDVPPSDSISVDNGVNQDAVGYTGSGTYRYLNHLQGFSGERITKVWFHYGGVGYYPTGISALTVKIYAVDGDTSLPGTELRSQAVDMSTLSQSGWYAVALTTPLDAPADQLFVGVEVQSSYGIAIGVDTDTDGGNESYAYAVEYGWATLASYGFYNNYMLRAELMPQVFDITVTPVDHGLVVADRATATAGETVNLTVTPGDGYELVAGSLKVNGTPVVGTSFEMPEANAVVTYEIKAIDYVVTVTPAAKGTVISDKATAIAGETVTLTVTPDAGYRLVPGSLKVNGVAVSGTSFVMPMGNATVTGEFGLVEVFALENEVAAPNTGDTTNNNLLMALCLASLLSALAVGATTRSFRKEQ